MHTPRFFCPQVEVSEAPFALPAEAAHHAARVLRLAAGDALCVFDGSGAEYPATVLTVDRQGCRVRLHAARHPQVESPLALHLGQGLTQADKYDLVLQKAVELGVASVTALSLRRSVVRLDADRAARRHAHWTGIATAACEQSGRVRLPVVGPVQSLASWIDALPAGLLRLRLAPEAGLDVAAYAPAQEGIALVVGPEGGFDPDEAAALDAAGFAGVRLGPRILRTETAALAALAALQSWHGDFRAAPPIIAR